jgi:hypothetical protein
MNAEVQDTETVEGDDLLAKVKEIVHDEGR